MIRDTPQPRSAPKQGNKKLADPSGALMALTKSKRWAASRTPRSEPTTKVAGMGAANQKQPALASAESPGGLAKKRPESQGVHAARARPARSPRPAARVQALHPTYGTLCPSP